MAVCELSVRGSAGRTPLWIGEGLLGEALPAFVAERNFSSVAIVTNETLAPLYGEPLAGRIDRSFLISIPDGEQYKTPATLQTIYDGLLAGGADRSTLVVALGGGVMGDMGGFAAATFMRGVALVQAPTSLLAMVDASIGAKTGVDLPQGKNLVGAFKDPLAIFADTGALATLPPVEVACGMAEVIKAGLIGNPVLFDDLRSGPAGDGSDFPGFIARAAAVKVEVVEQDRLEQGLRQVLNLGHTFGHALEQVSGYAWKHGHAVALGTAAATRLSARLGLCEADLVDVVEDTLRRWDLPVRYSGYDPQQLWEAMRHDKKWRGGQPHLILLEGVGKPVIKTDVPPGDVLAALEEVREA